MTCMLANNFAEHTSQLGRNSTLGFAYTIEYSLDGTTWQLLIDKSKNKEDISHDYIQLPNKQVCRCELLIFLLLTVCSH